MTAEKPLSLIDADVLVYAFDKSASRNIRLIACAAVAQHGSKLIDDRAFDHTRRGGFGGTRTLAVLPRRFTYVVATPPPGLGRVGGDHRSLAAPAVQQPREQSILWHANDAGPNAASTAQFPVDFLPHQRLHNLRLLTHVNRTPVFDVAGIDRIGEQRWRIDRIRNIRISVARLADGADIMFLSSPIQDIVARPLGDALDTFADLTLRGLDLNIALLCPQSPEMKPQTAAGLPDPRLPDLGESRACAAFKSYPGSSSLLLVA